MYRVLSINRLITILFILGILLIWSGVRQQSQEVTLQIIPTQTQISLAPTNVNSQEEQIKVIRVIDGDTIEIEGGQKVRYIGIDSPETVDPRRPVGCFGKEASLENKKLVEGKNIILEKDISETDKYGRLLRYVYLPNGVFVNDYLVRNGFAKVVTYPPDVKFVDQFLEAQRQASEQKRGLWQKCF